MNCISRSLSIQHAQAQDIPITNYGIAIAYMKGILKRSLLVFPSLAALIPWQGNTDGTAPDSIYWKNKIYLKKGNNITTNIKILIW